SCDVVLLLRLHDVPSLPTRRSSDLCWSSAPAPVQSSSATGSRATSGAWMAASPPSSSEPTARRCARRAPSSSPPTASTRRFAPRSEEHTSELQSRENLVCRLLLEKK